MFIRDHAFSIFVLVMSAGVVGLTLTYAKMLTGGFQWCVRQSAEVENLVCRPKPIWQSMPVLKMALHAKSLDKDTVCSNCLVLHHVAQVENLAGT